LSPRRQSWALKYYPILFRFFKFGLIGSTGVAVNSGVFFVLLEWLRIDYRLASLAAIECAIVNNFFWNFHWTWADRKPARGRQVFAMFVRFNSSSGIVAVAVNLGLLVALTEIVGIDNKMFSNLVGIAAGTAVNFVASHFWTFAKPREMELADGLTPKA